MKILITGNLGYIGPIVGRHLRKQRPQAKIAGLDLGYFAGCLLSSHANPDNYLDVQYWGDVRTPPTEVLQGVDAIVHLAALSNDPMGKEFEALTSAINFESTVAIAKAAKAAGVKTFTFASSCSVYGAGGSGVKTELDPVNPLTAYAHSKINSERGLEPLADANFKVTCLRFSTACGPSPRLRLDLVLNDFVASAVVNKKITILSDGTPWRPLIATSDMARAIDWAVDRKTGENFTVVNAGANEWNFTVLELAKEVARVMPGVTVDVAGAGSVDNRSYRVNFDKFKSLAPNHYPIQTLEGTIRQLVEIVGGANSVTGEFRNSPYIRLNHLRNLKQKNELGADLRWQF